MSERPCCWVPPRRIWDGVGMSETGNPFAFAPSRSDGLQQARRLLGKQRFRELFRQAPSSAWTRRSGSPLEDKTDAAPLPRPPNRPR